MVIPTISDHSLKKSIKFLSSLDSDWETLIQKVGPCLLKPYQRPPYEFLLKTIAFQQLHAKAAEAIFQRFLFHFNHEFPSPQTLLKIDPELLRASGFSENKTETLLRIAEASIKKIIPNQYDIVHLSDDEIIERLITIKGIGIWTAQMLLMFNLGRLDVLPIHDLGIQKGYQTLKKLDVLPKPKALEKLGSAWKPYRTIASWYLWRAN